MNKNFWEDVYRGFYDMSNDIRQSMVGKVFFSKHDKTEILIPVRCDAETTNALYREEFNVFCIWHNLDQPPEKYCVDIKAMIHSIDDESYSISWKHTSMTEYFAKTILIPKIVDYVFANCQCINGPQFLEYCNSIQEGEKTYD